MKRSSIAGNRIAIDDEVPLSRPRPGSPTSTVVFDSYWKFAAERQRIFFHRVEGAPPPWTEDSILASYRFTNAYRAADRVSQFLIRNVIYREDLSSSAEEILFRILLFKLFNKIETWRLLEDTLGAISFSDYTFDRYDKILKTVLQGGGRIYSGAYIMPPGQLAFGHTLKHQNHLRLIELMFRDGLPRRLGKASTMREAFSVLLSFPTIGPFLGYQLITDINYSELVDYSEMEFVMAGPGAVDGIGKCFADLRGYDESEVIRLVTESQEANFERLGISFPTLWGRPLQLIDCQNLFCEISKYSRVAYPQISGISGRTRIKQKYSPGGAVPQYWFPPKWGLTARQSKAQGRDEVPSCRPQRLV